MKACIHVLGDAGYVWDADGEPGIVSHMQTPAARAGALPPPPPPAAAPLLSSCHMPNTAFVLASLPPAVAHWLRLECGIVGAMVGGVASKQAAPAWQAASLLLPTLPTSTKLLKLAASPCRHSTELPAAPPLHPSRSLQAAERGAWTAAGAECRGSHAGGREGVGRAGACTGHGHTGRRAERRRPQARAAVGVPIL